MSSLHPEFTLLCFQYRSNYVFYRLPTHLLHQLVVISPPSQLVLVLGSLLVLLGLGRQCLPLLLLFHLQPLYLQLADLCLFFLSEGARVKRRKGKRRGRKESGRTGTERRSRCRNRVPFHLLSPSLFSPSLFSLFLFSPPSSPPGPVCKPTRCVDTAFLLQIKIISIYLSIYPRRGRRTSESDRGRGRRGTEEEGVASFPGSSPAFCYILYKQQGESLDDLITCMTTYYMYVWFYT